MQDMDGSADHVFRFAAMGSPCEIWFAERGSRRTAETVRLIRAEVARLEAAFSHFRPDSALNIANAAARRGELAPLSDEFVGLLDQAAAFHRKSGGCFDVTTGVLTSLWRNARAAPTESDISAALARTGLDKVHWSKGCLTFATPDLDIDLGGVVKEYAVDRAVDICMAVGHGGGFVSFGGDVRVFGPQASGEPWRLGIVDPRGGEAVATLYVGDGAIATSGDYVRYVEFDGMRYSHLISPHTGYPVDGWASVTVVAETCLEAGLAATSALVQGTEAEPWLLRHGYRFAVIDRNGSVSGPLMPR